METSVNNKCKAFTSLGQSKKLAEILPLESADMYYSWHDERYYIVNKDCPYPYSLKEKIPCWSLAALLKVIPKHIKDYNVFRIDIGDNDFSAWYNEIGFGVNSDLPNITMEESIDVCYELILKLHELNLL